MSEGFMHQDLDGVSCRVLGAGAVFEYRDPNDGQSAEARDKARHQYTLVDGVLLYRRLPPESVGDRWRNVATGRLNSPEEWTEMDKGILFRWPILQSWERWCLERLNLLLPGTSHGAGVRMVWMRSRICISGTGWPQSVPCPHCHDWLLWAEYGYVPGHRICNGCGRHWRVARSVVERVTDAGASDSVTTWILKPTGARS